MHMDLSIGCDVGIGCFSHTRIHLLLPCVQMLDDRLVVVVVAVGGGRE